MDPGRGRHGQAAVRASGRAVLGSTPPKPGRPSHVNHTYWASPLRLALQVEVHPGDSSHAKHSLPGLQQLLDELGSAHKPYLVRGDKPFAREKTSRPRDAPS